MAWTISSYGLVLSSVAILTVQAAFVMLQFDWTPIPAFAFIIVGLLISTLGSGSIYTITLPFALDQMIGASAEELSAVVQWYFFDIELDQQICLKHTSVVQSHSFLTDPQDSEYL